jgi:hypothetical protein
MSHRVELAVCGLLLAVPVVVSFALLCRKQLPAVSLCIKHFAQIRIAFDLVSPLAIVFELLRELNRVNFQVTAEPIAACFCQFVAGHWLPEVAKNLEALLLTGCHCWLDSLGGFVACFWVAVASDCGCGFGAVEKS